MDNHPIYPVQGYYRMMKKHEENSTQKIVFFFFFIRRWKKQVQAKLALALGSLRCIASVWCWKKKTLLVSPWWIIGRAPLVLCTLLCAWAQTDDFKPVGTCSVLPELGWTQKWVESLLFYLKKTKKMFYDYVKKTNWMRHRLPALELPLVNLPLNKYPMTGLPSVWHVSFLVIFECVAQFPWPSVEFF